MNRSATIMMVLLGVAIMLFFGYTVDLNNTIDELESELYYTESGQSCEYAGGHQIGDTVRTNNAYTLHLNSSVSGEVVSIQDGVLGIQDSEGELHIISAFWIVPKGF